MEKQFAQLLDRLQTWETKPPTSKQISLLSDIGPSEVDALREVWPHIPLRSRRLLISNLLAMSEADVSLDFTEVFLLALEDPDEHVRLGALEGLWEYDEEDFVPILIRMMDSDPSVQIRAEAAMNLGRFALQGELEELSPQTTDLVRRALIAAWNSPDQDVEVRRRALESVACLTGDDIGEMISAAYRDKDERMNVSAVYAMGQTLDDVWAPYVLKELKSPRPEMRYEAARSAGALELADAVPTLLDMIHDPDTEVRTAAIEALGDIGGERAVQALLELARSGNEAIREAALDALDVADFGENPLGPGILSWLLGQGAGPMGFPGWDEDLDEDDLPDDDDFGDDDEDEWDRDLGRDRWN